MRYAVIAGATLYLGLSTAPCRAQLQPNAPWRRSAKTIRTRGLQRAAHPQTEAFDGSTMRVAVPSARQLSPQMAPSTSERRMVYMRCSLTEDALALERGALSSNLDACHRRQRSGLHRR